MGTLQGYCKKALYQFISVAVDGYENQQIRGRIHHCRLKSEVEFNGWLDLMIAINQICDVTRFPRMTVTMRLFAPLKARELEWREEAEDDLPPAKSSLGLTFRLRLKYRYFASWQGNVSWIERERTYSFNSFMNFLNLLDCFCLSREPGNTILERSCTIWQIAVNSYQGNDMQGDLLQTMFNYKKSFYNISELVSFMTDHVVCDGIGKQSESVKIISCESLGYRRTGGAEATFAVRILYREHSTLQGMLYCRELKMEKPFRSFMEMLYLMASALEAVAAGSAERFNSDPSLGNLRII